MPSPMPSLDLSRLNSHQREAVLHQDGPLLVLAGAGSGKTNTMAHRIAYLVAHRRVEADRILGLSFTNKAARELKGRVLGMLDKAGIETFKKGFRAPAISTFHSLCARLLRANAEAIGYRPDFTIIDASDQRDTLRGIFKNLRIDDRKFDHDLLLSEISRAKNAFISDADAPGWLLASPRLGSDYQIAAAEAYPRYLAQLKSLNAFDFDDLLFQTARLLSSDEKARARYNQHFRYILVDEYQDTNPAQFAILRLLTRDHQNLCVVGDDDQSIYSWRGADSAHILSFSQQYKGAKVITLDQNYRSTGLILEAANEVIRRNKQRHAKTLWSDRGEGSPILEYVLEDDRDEGEFVAEQLSQMVRERSLRYADFAILYRSNVQSRIFEEALRRLKVPYKIVGGSSFLERKEVKDVLSFWRLVSNPRDDASLRRVINWPARGIGRSSLEAMSDHAFRGESPMFAALEDAATVAPRAAAAMLGFRDLILRLREDLTQTSGDPVAVAAWAKQSLERIQAKKAIEEDSEDPVQSAKRWENVEELLHSIGQSDVAADGPAALQEFLIRMTLESKDEEEDDSESAGNQVTLLTLHGAKGLEYPVVFLVGLEEGFLPHKRSIEEAADLSEERRLCYVGITRARDQLVLTRARTRIRYGKPVPRYRCRFLEDVPGALIVTENRSAEPVTNDAKAVEAHEAKVKGFLDSIRARIQS